MLLFILQRQNRWEVRQKPDELPKGFVLCLAGSLKLYTQGGDIIEPDAGPEAEGPPFRLYWVRDDAIWTVGSGVNKVALRGAVRDRACVVVGDNFLVELSQPEGCTLGPPAVRERAVVKDQWDRLMSPVV